MKTLSCMFYSIGSQNRDISTKLQVHSKTLDGWNFLGDTSCALFISCATEFVRSGYVYLGTSCISLLSLRVHLLKLSLHICFSLTATAKSMTNAVLTGRHVFHTGPRLSTKSVRDHLVSLHNLSYGWRFAHCQLRQHPPGHGH